MEHSAAVGDDPCDRQRAGAAIGAVFKSSRRYRPLAARDVHGSAIGSQRARAIDRSQGVLSPERDYRAAFVSREESRDRQEIYARLQRGGLPVQIEQTEGIGRVQG